MSKSNFLALLPALFAAPSLLAAERPNILFILSDDHRFDAIGCAGNEIIQTPNLDKLAAQGVYFKNAFATSSLSQPSRASIMTGMYESSHGCNFYQQNISPEQFENTYPMVMREAGYYTGFIGKFGFAVADNNSEDKTKEKWHHDRYMPKDKFDKWYGFASQGSYRPDGVDGKFLTEIIVDNAMEFLEERPSDEPFCLSISFKAPHGGPFAATTPYKDRYKNDTIQPPVLAQEKYHKTLPAMVRNGGGRDPYWSDWFGKPDYNKYSNSFQNFVKTHYGLITGLDIAVGQIVDKLKKEGLDKNTIIIYMGDNGLMFGERLLGGKSLLYDGSIRVPMIIYDPTVGKSAKGQVREDMVLNIDIAPTILSMAGVATPENMQGKNMTGLVKSSQKQPWRESFMMENNFTEDAKQPYPYCRGVRTDEWKYIRYQNGVNSTVYEELFDLRDPLGETKNLANNKEYADVLSDMRARFQRFKSEVKSVYR